MRRIKYSFAIFLRRIGNLFLRFSAKLLPTKTYYSQGVEEKIIKDFVSSNHTVDEIGEKKFKKKRKCRNWLRKTFITIGILAGIFVMYLVCAEIYFKIIFPRQEAADDARLLQEARVHPEKAGEIAIKFRKRTYDFNYNDENYHLFRRDPFGATYGKCQYDHETAYETALNLFAQYIVDSLQNNIEIFNTLLKFTLERIYTEWEYAHSHDDNKCHGWVEMLDYYFEMVKTDAEKGDVLSQFVIACEYERLGRIKLGGLMKYKYGKNQIVFREKAAYWYLRAAVQGYLPAIISIADCYKEGFGVETSFAEAKNWYEKAALAGDGYSMICLGDIYMNGTRWQNIVIKKDIVQAKYWWEKARETGKWNKETDDRLQKIHN